ncbi:uncharacterized protein LOC121379354 isoform X2 [Gigantopelta aegis]|nr:uncharacterized protein LOC121379354 isoform X2 [Gigantopelta aegis]XP_041363863.1 uncharacterized protein LOC121379354 isoform X2 [Gigantopelta aegis]
MKGLGIFCIWTLTSFLCHQSAKAFLQTSLTNFEGQGILLSLSLTLSQVLTFFSLVDIQRRWDKIFYMIILSHMAATFATNCSMAFMQASSTFAIKLMEPITSAVVQHLVHKTSLSKSTLISLPLIVPGAVVFVGNPFETSSISRGVLMACTSNIIVAIRNVTINSEGSKSTTIRLRPAVYVYSAVVCTTTAVAVVYAMELRGIVQHTTTLIICLMLTSSYFHVVYSFMSTNVLIHYTTVVSQGMINMVKRITVVFLMYLFGQRYATPLNFAGLAICILGIAIYIHRRSVFDNGNREHARSDLMKPPNCRRQLTWIYLGMLVTGMIMYVGNTGVSLKDIQKYASSDHLLHKTVTHSVKMVQHNSVGFLAESFKDRSFGPKSFKLMNRSQLLPDIEARYLARNKSQIKEFLNWRLSDHRQNTNVLAPMLATNTEIIREAQRIHFNLFGDMMGKYKYAMLFGIAPFENKGDSAISTGEVYLLRRLGIKIVHYCTFPYCARKNVQDYAQKLSNQYSKNELVIVFRGGGNLIGYKLDDIIRKGLMRRFHGFKMFIMPQSIFVRGNRYEGGHFDRCKKLYCCNANLTILLRDRQSLGIALKYWNNGTNLALAPDMAFQIGSVSRTMSPMYDVMWLKRSDTEAPKYSAKALLFPKNITVKISEWENWKTNKGLTTMETVFLMANNGLVFLQRGRVVITDRLHGHILSTLLNIPHVLIDNQYKKLSSFHNTWTRSLENVFITDDSSKAIKLALILLEKYKDELPSIAPIMDVKEVF